MQVSTLRPTPLMFAALDHLAASGERALVLTYSGWWVRESEREAARGGLGAPHVDLKERLVSSGAFWARDREPHVMIPNAVVRGLVARGLMKYTGTKRRVNAAANRKDFHRAELTPAARELMAARVDAARGVLGDVLAKVAPR